MQNKSLMPILPNSTIGVIGSGQLGRMLTIEARKMGYRVHTYSPDSDTPTGQVADEETVASYEDLDSVRGFARNVDVITFEFENVPAETMEAAAEILSVFPRGDILYTTQNRLREKQFLSNNGFPLAPFRHVKTREDLDSAVGDLGIPCVLKTAGFGYDGKGQTKLARSEDADAAFKALNGSEGVLEAFIDFAKEVSVVCARSQSGEFVDYGVIENQHRDHILDVSIAPADVDDRVRASAREITRSIAESLNYVGKNFVEFILTAN
jgi:5-(carboxyamino)imidazole ribonucleotide synthase